MIIVVVIIMIVIIILIIIIIMIVVIIHRLRDRARGVRTSPKCRQGVADGLLLLSLLLILSLLL